MKVLQINSCYGYASTGTIVQQLAEYIDAKGYDCRVAYSTGTNIRVKDIVIGNIVDRKFHAIMARITGKQGYFSRIATIKLIRKIKSFNPDIIHLHNLHSNNLNYKLLFEYLAKVDKAVLITLHDCFPFTGKCCHYTAVSCDKWKESCGNCPKLKMDIPSLFFDKTNTMLSDKKNCYDKIKNLTVIGVSNWITNEAKKSPIFSSNVTFKTMYNWIDLDSFRIFENLEKDNRFIDKFNIICVASRWSYRKGLQHIIDLSHKLQDNEQIVLIGSISDRVILPANIINIPNTNSVSELVKYYNMADVFLQASMEETFGKVTAEALACGTPVVVMNSTASPELVKANCGFVNKTFTIDESLGYIAEIKQNGKQSYSQSCREFASENFDKHKLLEEFLELYKKLQ